jgi:hypothetical protein
MHLQTNKVFLNMKFYKTILFTFIASLLFFSCTSINKLQVNSNIKSNFEIETFANCIGPNGAYTTKVISYKDGGCLFEQKYTYKNQPFMAKIEANQKGYIFDSLGNRKSELNKENIIVIQSHEFHKMASMPHQFFNSIEYIKDTLNTLKIFTAKDKINNSVTILFNNITKQIMALKMYNPANINEEINVKFTEWQNTEYGNLLKKLEILQAGKDRYLFDFIAIKINGKFI